jgi:predicted transposase YbfD/YdcC
LCQEVGEECPAGRSGALCFTEEQSMSSSLSFFEHFALLQEPRVERTKLHPLMNVLFIAVCALLSGANDFVGMEKFGKAKRAWLAKFLDLSNGIPSHDTFGRVVQALDPEQFLRCFRHWVQAFADSPPGRHIAIDGKTARASLHRPSGQKALHVVSAWAREAGLVLGQVAVEEKSNEITAIPKLLEMLELGGAIVTIDALGCQKEIAAKIRQGGGDYVLAVKGNHDQLEQDIIAHFQQLDETAEHGRTRRPSSLHETEDGDHGRQEYRRCEAAPVPLDLRGRDAWMDLKTIGRVTRVYSERGQEKSEVRYFISSLAANARCLGAAVRGHWSVENNLHWVLDMTFAEDRSRARMVHAQENLARLRRWALSVLKQDEAMSGSLEKKRLMAGWDTDNLEKLLGLF